jgi:hypothetical protein
VAIGGGGGAPAPAPPATVPGEPTITLLTPGDATIVVDFTAPSDGGSALTLYEYVAINQSIIGAPDISGTVVATPSLSQLTVPGLTNGQGYTVKLRAQNSVGWGAYSAEAGPVIPIGPPGAPTITLITPGNQQLSVAFTAGSSGGDTITNYQYTTNNGATWITRSPLSTTSPILITGLTNGTSYGVRLRAINSVGVGAASNLVIGTPATTPAAPTGLSAIPGNAQASISFTQTSNGGSAITNYSYSFDNISYTPLAPPDAASPITITGLTNGTTYTIYLKAINAIGSSAASASVSVTPTNVGGNVNLIILGNNAVTTLRDAITTAKTNLGYSGTLAITTQVLNGYTGSDLSLYDIAIWYTDGGLNLNTTLGTNLNNFVTSGKHLIMASFCWGNVPSISTFEYATNSTYAYKGSMTLVNTGSVTYSAVHPITTGILPSTGTGSQNIPNPITSTADSTVIATFNDGPPATSFIATKQRGSSKLVGINLYVPIAYSESTASVAKYVCNSVYWCMGYLT